MDEALVKALAALLAPLAAWFLKKLWATRIQWNESLFYATKEPSDLVLIWLDGFSPSLANKELKLFVIASGGTIATEESVNHLDGWAASPHCFRPSPTQYEQDTTRGPFSVSTTISVSFSKSGRMNSPNLLFRYNLRHDNSTCWVSIFVVPDSMVGMFSLICATMIRLRRNQIRSNSDIDKTVLMTG